MPPSLGNGNRGMTIQERLDRLLAAAESIGIAVEKAPMGGDGGGLAVLAGKRRLYLDTMADSTTAYEITLNALATLPEIDALELPAPLRIDIDKLRKSP